MFKKLDKMLERYEKLNELVGDPEVVAKIDEWKAYSKELADMTETVEKYSEYKKTVKEIADLETELVKESDKEMRDMMQEEILSCKEKLEIISGELRVLLLPKDPDDDKNVIMEIRAGAGGEEASLFAYELYRMYVKYAEKNRWKTEEIDNNSTELGGIKEVVFSISGKSAFGKLKFESGVHRVQRVPDVNRDGRGAARSHRRRNKYRRKRFARGYFAFERRGRSAHKQNRIVYKAYAYSDGDSGALSGRAFADEKPRKGYESLKEQVIRLLSVAGGQGIFRKPPQSGGNGRQVGKD